MHCSKCMSNDSLSAAAAQVLLFAWLKCQTKKKKEGEKMRTTEGLRFEAKSYGAVSQVRQRFLLWENNERKGRQEQRGGGILVEPIWRREVDFIPPEERRQTRKRRHAHSPAAFLRLTKVCPDFITGLGLEGATAFVSGSSRAAEDRRVDAATAAAANHPRRSPKPHTATDKTHGLDVASISVPSAEPAVPSSPPA